MSEALFSDDLLLPLIYIHLLSYQFGVTERRPRVWIIVMCTRLVFSFWRDIKHYVKVPG